MSRKVWEVNLGPTKPLGHEQLTVGVTAADLPNIPPDARRALVRTLGQPINWTDDGGDPTGTVGMTLFEDESLVIDGALANFKMIRTSAATGDADVRIAYYGNDQE